jgi:hypothetical protein
MVLYNGPLIENHFYFVYFLYEHLNIFFSSKFLFPILFYFIYKETNDMSSD